jgi:hypothetical protein
MPEWVPQLRTDTNVSNFDQEFTNQAIDWQEDVGIVGHSAQTAFQGFTCRLCPVNRTNLQCVRRMTRKQHSSVFLCG